MEEIVNDNKSEEAPVTTAAEDDPYSYLERDDFTSEKFKIEVRGLPKYYGIGEFRKFINEKLQLNAVKIKPPKKRHWAYISFRDEESRERAIETLNGAVWKNAKLTAQNSKPLPDPFIKKQLEAKEQDGPTAKRMKSDKEDTKDASERIKDTTIPLWNLDYPSQLEEKRRDVELIVASMGQQMLKENKDLQQWFKSQKELHRGFPLEMKQILGSPVTDGYRNKCEFTIGKNADDEITIGFRLSSYASGSVMVGPIGDLYHIPDCMKTAIRIFQEFVSESKLEPFNPVNQSGHWRQVMARCTRNGHLMLIIGVRPQGLEPQQLEDLKDSIKNFFETGKGKEANVTSLYFQATDKRNIGCGSENDTLLHLSGTEYIEEELLGLKFQVSPQAFFQINTLGAEILYQAAIDLAKPDTDTAVLDICCGTGTIGLCFSKHCGEVLGLEVIADAIKDARKNATKNSVTNCEFFVGKAEDVLSAVINRTTKSNVIAVVDPPRAGLHHRAVLALRKAKKVSKLIYISCDPKAATKNLIDFARPSSKQYHGEPFVPVTAIPIDMFPHTRHCELVLCLERLSNLESKTS